jgi:nitrite reductase (NO-forming)
MVRKIFAIFMILVLSALVACGGGDDGASLEFSASDEFRFSPATAVVSNGEQVRVTLENNGQLDHSWTLVPADTDNLTVRASDAIGGGDTGLVAGGESATVDFTAPEQGAYKFVCTVPGHAAAGMVGSFTVD